MNPIEESRECSINSALSYELVAPIPSHYKELDHKLVEYEHLVFDDELYAKAASLGKTIREIVSLQLLPASTVVMEEFSREYAEQRVTGENRQKRVMQTYQLGAVIGLAASSLIHPYPYLEEVHPETAAFIAKKGIVTCDQPSEEVVANIDYKVKKIVDTVATHFSGDRVEESAQLNHATTTGYYVSRSLAALTIK